MSASVIPFIFASGHGTRLHPFTKSTPKPLIPVLGEKTILDLILQHLIAAGFTTVYINYSYQRDLYLDLVHRHAKKIKVILVPDKKVCGQGGILLQEKETLTAYDYVLGLNGDTIIDFDLKKFCTRGKPDEVLLLSDNHHGVITNLICDQSGVVYGIKQNNNTEPEYWYGQDRPASQQLCNFLGIALIPTAPLSKLKYDNKFMGFFCQDELTDQLFDHHLTVRTVTMPIKQFLTANTVDDLTAMRAILQ